MRNIMIDLETMSTAPDAAIVEIGAVEFDDEGNTGDEFYAAVDLQDSINVGLRLDAPTINWWMQQSDAARFDATEGTHSLQEGLADFSGFYKVSNIEQDEPTMVWGNGASFDLPILRSAYIACGIEVPFKYNTELCLRTLRRSAPNVWPKKREGTHHNALADALHQVEWYKLLTNHNKPNQ